MFHLRKDSRSHRQEPRGAGLAFTFALVVIVLPTAFALTYAADPPQNQPPVIEWFMISEGPAFTYEFFGYVSDPDNSTEGYVVEFGGIVEGDGLEATVGFDGSFDEVFILPNAENGVVTADTVDPLGAPAETAAYDLQVTPP